MEAKTPLEKYVEAGKEFTEASLKRAQIIMRDLARESEYGREQAGGWADDFVQRAEELSETVRNEIARQIKALNLATNQDVIKLVQQFVERTTKATAPTRDAAAPTREAGEPAREAGEATASKATAASGAASGEATPAKKTAPAKKAAAKKTAPAKKAAAPAKKASAKKAAPAKKAPAKRAVAAEKTAPVEKAPSDPTGSAPTTS